MRLLFLLLFCITIITGFSASAQTTLNPDISLVGDFQIFSHNDKSIPDEKEKLNLSDPEIELNINGYLNPYARADAVIAWHGDHNAEIEEAYATFLQGLPLNINLRAGKYLLEFGRLNTVHPHAYSFIKRPLPHAMFFGEEGLSDMAIRASISIPTGEAFTELMGGILKGDALTPHVHEEEETTETTEPKRDLGFFGRLTSSFAVSEAAELAMGGSVINTVYGFGEDEENPAQLRSWLIGGDVKYKYKPSRYTSLQIEAEGIMRQNEMDEEGEDLKSYGAYGYIDYRFKQKYNLGAIYEWVRSKEAHHHEGEEEHEIHQQETKRLGLFVGFAPVEETSLIRLAGHLTDPEDSDSFWEATLQLVISLGPHKPHNF
ncbi:MAG: hypothetical protein ABIJ12_02630 [bacterium]